MSANSIGTKWASLTPYFHALLRIFAAFMFIQPGTMKLFAFPNAMPGGATAEFLSQVWIGGVLEVFGGALILVGLCTRPVAFILAGEMAVAYWQFHAPNGFWVTVNMGTAAALYCFVWLYFSAAGSGPWSIDALIQAKRK